MNILAVSFPVCQNITKKSYLFMSLKFKVYRTCVSWPRLKPLLNNGITFLWLVVNLIRT